MLLPPTLLGINATLLKWLSIFAAVAGILLAAYNHGRHVVEGEKAKSELSIALAYAGEIVATQNTAEQLAADNEKLRATQTTTNQVITKEVIRYEFLTPPGDRCVLPGTWRLLHDAAATGAPAPAEAGPMATGAADPVADAAALRTVTDNYAACRDSIEKVKAWQRRYQALELDHEKTD
jgi:hypothetical protein